MSGYPGAKDLIISGGYNVYPKEIGLILDDIDGTEESAVIGVPHADFGEAVVAVAVRNGEWRRLTLDGVKSSPDSKCPKRIFFVDELPRNAMGKVQKNLHSQNIPSN